MKQNSHWFLTSVTIPVQMLNLIKSKKKLFWARLLLTYLDNVTTTRESFSQVLDFIDLRIRNLQTEWLIEGRTRSRQYFLYYFFKTHFFD